MRVREVKGEMRKITFTLVMGVLLAFSDSSFGIGTGTVWVGQSSTTGQVVRPDSYEQAVATLRLSRFTFDNYGAGTVLNNVDLGGVILSANAGGASLTIDTSRKAGAEPASPPNVLYVDEAPSNPTKLTFLLTEPVKSLGFVLGGLGSSSYLRVYDEQAVLVGSYPIPSALSVKRRWIAVMENNCWIKKVELVPDFKECYAIDDLELGHAPEPGSLVLFMGMAWMLGGHKRRLL